MIKKIRDKIVYGFDYIVIGKEYLHLKDLNRIGRRLIDAMESENGRDLLMIKLDLDDLLEKTQEHKGSVEYYLLITNSILGKLAPHQ